MTTQTTTQTASLSAINPLIAHDEWSEDTASNIRGALNFIADALTATGPGMLNEETAHGVARLIMCCTAAMEVTKA